MNYFCTLFDSYYLTRGIALYKSLERHCKDFHLYVFAFDQKSLTWLNELNYKHMTVVSQQEFEDEELKKLKQKRTKAEYCWTCTPSILKFSIERFKLPFCTYLDADIYFFSDPRTLLEEIGEKSVLITEHRYTPKYDQSEKSGKYCVQFMGFKNSQQGLEVLEWWRRACNDWCYNRHEDGKFGDQKYLDDWLERFAGVHSLRHLGGGVAPWNIQQYSFHQDRQKVIGTVKGSQKSFPIVFYHFHQLKFDVNALDLGSYEIENSSRELIYKPYVEEILSLQQQLESKGVLVNKTEFKKENKLLQILRLTKRYNSGIHNRFNPETWKRSWHT